MTQSVLINKYLDKVFVFVVLNNSWRIFLFSPVDRRLHFNYYSINSQITRKTCFVCLRFKKIFSIFI